MKGTNTLAYYENSQLVAVKSFIILAPGGTVMQQSSYKYENSWNPASDTVKDYGKYLILATSKSNPIQTKSNF